MKNPWAQKSLRMRDARNGWKTSLCRSNAITCSSSSRRLLRLSNPTETRGACVPESTCHSFHPFFLTCLPTHIPTSEIAHQPAMEIPLAQEALYSAESYSQHRLRTRRRPDGGRRPEGVSDVSAPDTCWERAGNRSRQLDPHCERALARIRQFSSGE